MSFLLDTNVVSEWTRARPHRGVETWLAAANEDQLYLSVVTLAAFGAALTVCRPARDGTSWMPGSAAICWNASKIG